VSIAQGKSYYFKHYQVEDGLSYNSVICSMQDSRGFLWFGTKNGLNRFDGYSFKNFQHNPKAFNSIGSNYIYSLVEDGFQNIWVGTSRGLYQYNPIVENFTRLKETNGNVIEIKIDNRGDIWFISDFNLFKYNLKTKVIQDYSSKIGFVTSIIITEDETVWLSSGEGYLAQYISTTDSFERHNVYTHSAYTLTNWIPIIQLGGKNTILIGTQSQGLKIFNTESLIYEDVLAFNPDHTPIYIRDIMHYQDDEYWLATESGIFIYDLKKGLKKHLRKDRNDPFSLSDNAVYTLTKDKDGGVWAGTYFGGVNYFTKENMFFEKIFSRSIGNILKNNAVRELSLDQYGTIWIGTEDAGLVKYEPRLDKFTAFIADGKKESISHNNIHGLLVTKDELWIGTFEQGLDVMDIKTGKIIRNYKAGDSNLESNFIESLYLTKNDELYVGASSGLYRYNKSQDDFEKIQEIPSMHIHAIIEDKQGILWIASSNNGVYSFNPKSGLTGSLKHEERNPNSLLNNYINDLTIDSQENLWITTENGLSKYNLKHKTFNHLSGLHDFPSNVFYKVLEADDKSLWISTSKGLIHLDSSLKKWKLFTKNNGLLNDQFNYKSGYKTSDGSLYFGSVKGLIKFNPIQKVPNTHKPPVYFTGFQVSNQELEINISNSPLKKSVLFTDTIILKPKQSTFSIDFAALSYASPQMTEYAYRMKGVEDDWVYLKTNRKVYFTNLSPGDYLFEVKATTNSEWGDETTSLRITVQPPFLASNFAFLIYFIVLATVAYFIHKFNLGRLNEKNQRKFTLFESKKEREIYRAKLQFFTNITHEIRTPLTLIKGPLEMAMESVEPDSELSSSLTVMKKNTDRLIHLTDELLNFRKAEADNFALSFVNANVGELLDESYNRFLPLAKTGNRSFEIKTPDTEIIAFIDEEAIRKILGNLFSNAIKYSKGKILVNLERSLNEENFTIKVKTDGKLISLEMGDRIFEPFFRLKESENQSGTGIGLALARSLAELHGGQLILAIPEDSMNIFVLELPIHQDKAYKLFDETLKVHTKEPLSEKSKSNEKGVQQTLKRKAGYLFDQLSNNENNLTVLIVEDNAELIHFISTIMNGNYNVLKARNGEEALAILKENTVNLIISDIMMPIMDGYELCRQLKKDLDYSHIPIVLLSAKGSVESKVDGLGTGADSYIEKPFSPQYLLAQVESLLANREKIRTYFASSPLVHIKTMAYSAMDSKFLEKLNEVLNENLDNSKLDVEQLAWLMNMSRPTLYRKIKAICDLSPLELITITRLKKAAELLVESDYKISKIASNLGFSSQTQFTRSFVKQFEISPSKYRASKITDKKK
jgi:signal transduction histidine kinase/ligand-binding sensor domain-containing protein/DNA-binding response OmpR family regulator